MKNLKFYLIAGTSMLFVSKTKAQVADALSSQTGEVTSIVETITNWVLILFSLLALVQLIIIFTSGQGSGEEKIKKAGTWIFMLVFCAVGYFISKAIFPST